MKLKITPVESLQGTITVPGDKSISHRAVMLGALANGKTEISNFLMGEDCLSTIKCFRAMGVDITENEGVVTVNGMGLTGLQEPKDVLDCGNSGTTTRLLLGILAGQPFFSVLTGDQSLRRRPMGRVTAPLNQMGAAFAGRQNTSLLPLAVTGGNLKAIKYKTPVASAQLKSSILLAGLFADGETMVEEPAKSRDHTERMLQRFGAQLKVDGCTTTVMGKPKLKGQKFSVPSDISSAAFFMVAAAIVPGSNVTIKGVSLNPTRNGIIEVLQKMDANISIINKQEEAGEPMGDIRIRGGTLKGTVIDGAIIPRLIDEIPVLAIAAAVAEGKTIIKDAAELRIKETDRVATTASELAKFGVDVQEQPDGMIIEGGKPMSGAVCQSHGDHRIAMAMAVAGMVASGETVVQDAEIINISFPGFDKTLKMLINN
ncbi:MAG: 3-phosphoshikimate 1-carboxyvinyltransferase [Firmicutes bacterium]|nr:3-phosphoshikimate 1-carboxyvinyltransferase [Bacillota bacterium]